MSTVIVSNLPHDTTEHEVRVLLAPFGPLGDVKFAEHPRLHPTDALVAFVELPDGRTAMRARHRLNESTYKDRAIRVDLYLPAFG